MANDCLFCKIVDGKIPSNRLYEDEVCIAFPDINPQAPTHLLVIPKQHVVSLAHTAAEHAELLGKLLAATVKVAEQQSLERGYRVVLNTGVEGGQTVHHLHLHLLGGRFMGWPPG
jgi:histidine triad (HIT) family protein